MEQQHGHTVSVDFGLEFSPVEPVSEYVVIDWKRSVLYQRDLRHEILRVGFYIADDREVPSGIRDVYIDDLSVFAGRLNTEYRFGRNKTTVQPTRFYFFLFIVKKNNKPSCGELLWAQSPTRLQDLKLLWCFSCKYRHCRQRKTNSSRYSGWNWSLKNWWQGIYK